MYYLYFSLSVLLIISGFISGAETAITRTSRARAHHLAKNGSKRALLLQKIQENMSESISTMLIINHILNFVISSITTRLSMRAESAVVEYSLSVLMVFLIIVYAEIFPKMLALYNSSKYALISSRTVAVSVKILQPLVIITNFFAKCTLRIFSININAKKADDTEEELLGAIDLHAPTNTEDDTQKRFMLKSILDLEDITVTHVMTHRQKIWTVNIDDDISVIAQKLYNCPYSRIPVWRGNKENIVGILLLKTFFRNMQNSSVVEIESMLTKPWFVLETTPLLDQMQDFKRKREHFAIVVDEYGDLLGCITLEDIIEEIIGEIANEHDDQASSIVVCESDGSIIVDGTTSTRDLNRRFEWDLPEDDAVTIAGMIMQNMRKIPHVGEMYKIGHLTMEILKKDKNQIISVKIINDSHSDIL